MSKFNTALPFTDTLRQLRTLIPSDQTIYLVGGAVRDALLRKTTHDLDFVLPNNVSETGRLIADTYNAAFYPLDEKRETVRVIILSPDGVRQIFDFSAQRGDSLWNDLIQRDFTINAIAVDLHNPSEIIDPLGGVKDLNERILRVCSPKTYTNDPLRIMRAVRLAVTYNLFIAAETRKLIPPALDGLNQISPERIRDELFRILDGSLVASALRNLDRLGAMSYVLPEIQRLKDVPQSPPHIEDVYTHSIETTRKLAEILDVFSLGPKSGKRENWAYGYASLRLGRYRHQLHSHLEEQLNPERTARSLLSFGALYHDCGKSSAAQYDADNQIHFHEHDWAGAALVQKRAQNLRLSNSEVERLVSIVRNHMRPLNLTQTGVLPTKRAVFRFFRDTGSSGVDVCLLSLADILATYKHTLPQDLWARHVDTIHALFKAWWEERDNTISPPVIISGNELMEQLKIKPGPMIGILLNEIKESQAAGAITNSVEAIEYARKLLNQQQKKS